MPPFPPMTGRAIANPESFQNFMNLGIGAEIIYSFVIIVCSLMIYYGTKELYELSSYKGIKYFRRAFLFFALAYFFRSFIKFFLRYFNLREIFDLNSKHIVGPITMFIFMFFSSMAIFYLLYSVMSKRWKNDTGKIYLFHILALIIAFISVIFRNPFIHLAMSLILLVVVIFIVYITHKENQTKTKSHLYMIYILLMIFWTLNIIELVVPKFLSTFQLVIYLSSIGIFLMILYRVMKFIGN